MAWHAGRRARTGIALLAVVVTGIWQPAWGEPVTAIRNNGDPANRVDVVILGDGYTAAELTKYADDVEAFVQGMFAQEPFREYQGYFNVHRVDVESGESGADHPEEAPPTFRDTALDATYDCAGIPRLLCVDLSKVMTVLSRSVSMDRRDTILVLVNDIVYGGSGGAIAVASLHPQGVELTLHELGHSFGLLADEYGGPPPPSCSASVEPFEVNATREIRRADIKWTHWVDPATPVPTPSSETGVPGLYEGARYCDAGLYRPTFDSKMRSLQRPFEEINTEQLVKRVYNWASPIDSTEPIESTIVVGEGESQTFRVDVLKPSTHSLDIFWTVDDQPVGSGPAFVLSSSGLTAGPHTVEVVVSDPTALVRNDPARALTDTRAWRVSVHTLRITGPAGGGPNPVASGGAANLSVTAVDSAGHALSYAWTTSCPTLGDAGSLSNPAIRNPSWTAPVNVTGSHQDCTISVTVSDGQGLSQASSYSQGVSSVAHTLAITSGPSGTPNPVDSEGTASLSVAAVDSLSHTPSYAWSASCPGLGGTGSFSSAAAQSPTWTAPANIGERPEACAISVTISDGQGLSETASFAQSVAPVDMPTLTPSLTGTTFGPGATMILAITLTPGALPTSVDAYIVIALPDGSLFSLQSGGVTRGVAPVATAFRPRPFAGEVLRYTFTGQEPPGTYAWFAALTQAGTPNLIGAVQQVVFTVSR